MLVHEAYMSTSHSYEQNVKIGSSIAHYFFTEGARYVEVNTIADCSVRWEEMLL